jgi:excisionase family DNA binding protein
MDTARREVLTVKELATLVGVTPNTIYRHASNGSIPTVRAGRIRRVLFPRQLIEQMLREGDAAASDSPQDAPRTAMPQVAA